MALKIKRVALPTTAAGASSGEVTFATFDDTLSRHLIGALMTVQVAGIVVQVMRVGKPVMELEGGVMAQMRGFIPADAIYDSAIPMSFNVINNSGGAVAALQSLLVMYRDGQADNLITGVDK